MASLNEQTISIEKVKFQENCKPRVLGQTQEIRCWIYSINDCNGGKMLVNSNPTFNKDESHLRSCQRLVKYFKYFRFLRNGDRRKYNKSNINPRYPYEMVSPEFGEDKDRPPAIPGKSI